jgi:hypothetical protein
MPLMCEVCENTDSHLCAVLYPDTTTLSIYCDICIHASLQSDNALDHCRYFEIGQEITFTPIH